MYNFEERIAELNVQIEVFNRLVLDYPNNLSYAELLIKLRQKRVELVATIGNKEKE